MRNLIVFQINQNNVADSPMIKAKDHGWYSSHYSIFSSKYFSTSSGPL